MNASNFQLGTPPRRSSSNLRSSTLGRADGGGLSSEGIGLGLRRVASSSGVPDANKKD